MNIHSDCLFCNIVARKIPSSIVFEDKDFLAFLDIMPINKGHILIIPKKHYIDIFDLKDDVLANYLKTIQKIAKAVKEAMKCDGINIGMNNGKAAGQAVFHAHIHIMPRFEADGYDMWKGKKYETTNEMQQIALSIRKLLERK